MPSPFACWDCGGEDHRQAECPEREAPDPDNRKSHEERIAKYVEWSNGNAPLPGRITPRQKQDLIKAENQRWADSQPKRERKAS